MNHPLLGKITITARGTVGKPPSPPDPGDTSGETKPVPIPTRVEHCVVDEAVEDKNPDESGAMTGEVPLPIPTPPDGILGWLRYWYFWCMR